MKRILCLAALALTFYLGLQGGYLALWSTDMAQPVEVFPYRAALYPKMDQSALRAGITVESADHLKQLLEDFLS